MKEKQNGHIKYTQIILILGSIIIGYFFNNIIQNITEKEQINFTTIEVISFTITILLSASSFVLAILAIYMSRTSEKLLIDRNDKGINQQSELFMKTLEILNRIESSTGVTEKRIEDIIAGRTGEVTNKLVRDKIITPSSKERFQKDLETGILNDSLSVKEKEFEKKELNDKIKNLNLLIDYYTNSSNTLFSTIANTDKINLLKIGEGKMKSKGEDLLDAFYERDGLKFGVCYFLETDLITEQEDIGEYKTFIENLINGIIDNTYNQIFIAINEKGTVFNNLNIIILEKAKLIKEDVISNIQIIIGEPDSLYKEIITKINK